MAALAAGPPRHAGEIEPLTAIIEDIRSLFNVGSIFRTADGAGVKRLFLTGITGCPPRRQIEKTSLGADAAVAWEYHKHALDVLPSLRQAGIFLLALECGREPLADVIAGGALRLPICLVVGNEVHGINAETLSACDAVASLPMRGRKESLNVSVAFGIAAYALAGMLAADG